jgi:hypothetical protein
MDFFLENWQSQFISRHLVSQEYIFLKCNAIEPIYRDIELLINSHVFQKNVDYTNLHDSITIKSLPVKQAKPI